MIKMLILPNFVYKLNALLIKILELFFIAVHRLILKFMWKVTEHTIAKTILMNKNKVRGITMEY